MEPAALGFHLRGCGLPQRTQCAPEAHNAHVCRPRSIFTDVHAAGENDFNFFALASANSARLFSNLK